MTIFIGRNIEERTRMWLEQQQVNYVAKALIDIELLQPDFTFFRGVADKKKQWIITSQWAAQWFVKYYSEIGFRSSETVYCLSEKQAALLFDVGIYSVVPEEKNVECLANLIHSSDDLGFGIYLKGDRSGGFPIGKVAETVVYQNRLLKPNLEKEYSVYVFFSPSGVDSFVEGNNSIPPKAEVVVIGQTTAQRARNFFRSELHVSTIQSELDVVKLAVAVGVGIVA